MSPIRPENRDRYPADWLAIRARILARAKHRCEQCGVHDHALGWRDADGRFHRTGGNAWHEEAGTGRLPLTEVNEAAQMLNLCDGLGPDCERAVVIVLTIAHLNHQPEDCRDENLRALCQQCHNRYDAATRRAGLRERQHVDQGQLFGSEDR